MKKTLSVTLVYSTALSLAAYGGGNKPIGAPATAAAEDTIATAVADTTMADTVTAPKVGAKVANKDKSLVQFNRQPSSSATGQPDMIALNFDKGTCYVGFDANQGAELQGTMAKSYIEKNIDSIDHNGSGIIGYVLATDGIGHNDSIVRIRGICKALGTMVEKDGNINSDPVGTNADGTAVVVQDGPIGVGRETYVVREFVSQGMKNSVGATQDAATADNVVGTWSSSFGDQIDAVAPDDDGMGMSAFNAWSKGNKVPTLSYDANSDAIAAIVEDRGGTIGQHADVQAHLILRILRNALDEVGIDTGVGITDDVGNALSSDVYVYKVGERSYYTLNVAVTAENYTDFTDSTVVYAPVSNQLDEASHATKNVWLNVYNSAGNFLGLAYQLLLQRCDKLFNPKVGYIGGDGQTESNIISRLGNPNQYDTFTINMVKIDSIASYASLLEQ